MVVDFNEKFIKKNLRQAMEKLGIDNEEGLAKYDSKNINSDMIKILERLILRKQYLEDSFYSFIRTTVGENDSLIFFAFLLEYFQMLITAFEGITTQAVDNEEYNIIMKYLYDNKMRVINSYISRELLENMGIE